ncbi:hypothetical protein F4778DRAFT_57950 [Xylariomycetidae sp. FL2044]|nr:hypothetical protein F4778DRAFT_57950 [Xylariomycetidae sp. FL2044]
MGQNSSQMVPEGSDEFQPEEGSTTSLPSQQNDAFPVPSTSSMARSAELAFSSQFPNNAHSTNPVTANRPINNRRQPQKFTEPSPPQPQSIPHLTSSSPINIVQSPNPPQHIASDQFDDDLPASSDRRAHSTSQSKKKRRSKKQAIGTLQPAHNNQHPPIPPHSFDHLADTAATLNSPTLPFSIGDSEPSATRDPIPSHALNDERMRKQQKREKKERRRAERLARQQADAASDSGAAPGISTSQFRIGNNTSAQDLAPTVESHDPFTMPPATRAISPKKSNKRKRRSQEHAASAPQLDHSSAQLPTPDNETNAEQDTMSSLNGQTPTGNSHKARARDKKRHKTRHTKDHPVLDSVESQQDDQPDNHELSFGGLAANLYAGRPRHNSAEPRESFYDRLSQLQQPQDGMELDEPAMKFERPDEEEGEEYEGVMKYEAPGEDEADEQEGVRTYEAPDENDGDDEIIYPEEEEDEDGGDPDSDIVDFTLDRDERRPGSSADDSERLDEQQQEGSTADPELPDNEHQVPRDNQHAVQMNEQMGNQDVPQEDEQHSAVVNAASGRRARSKSGTARKRFAKASFFCNNNAEEETADLAEAQPSPSTAAASRKKRTRALQAAEDQAVAESSNAASRSKQPRISAMLKGAANDNPKSSPASAPKKQGRGKKEYRTGPWSDIELHNVGEVIKRYMEDKGMTQKEVNTIIQMDPKKADNHDLWDRLVAACPDRQRQKIINQCRRKYHNFVARGTWTTEQHDELKRMWELHGKKYAFIGQQINRHPEDVRDRIRNYIICGDNRRTWAWSVDEEEQLGSIVMDAIEVITQLRQQDPKNHNPDTKDEELIDWQMVSEKMNGTRSRLQCITKWKILKGHMQGGGGSIDGEVMTTEEVLQTAREEADALSARQRYNIIKNVVSTGASAESRIPWAKVRKSQKEKEIWSRATLMIVWYRLKLTVPDWKIMSISEIASHLMKRFRDTKELAYPDDEDYDAEAEYNTIAQKVEKILRIRKAYKTPRIVVKTDDDDDDGNSDEDEGDEGEGNEGDGEGAASGEDDVAADDEGNNRIQVGDGADSVIGDEEAGPPLSKRRGSSIDLGMDANHEASRINHVLEIEDSDPDRHTERRGRQPKRSARTYGSRSRPSLSSAKKSKKNVQSSSAPNDDSDSPTSDHMLSRRKRKGKGKQPKPLDNQDEDVAYQSSDTSASQVESIPAQI